MLEQKQPFKGCLKSQYVGYARNAILRSFYKSDLLPQHGLLYKLDFLVYVYMGVREDKTFSVGLEVIKSRDGNLYDTILIFDSCIDAMVCYEGVITDVMSGKPPEKTELLEA